MGAFFITTTIHFLLVKICHKLSGEALADIIQLIDLHCVPSPQSRPIKTLRELKQYFENTKGTVEQKFYCKLCHSLLPMNDVTACPVCNTNLRLPSTKGYFLAAPIESQLKTLFSRKYSKYFHPLLSLQLFLIGLTYYIWLIYAYP